MAIRILTLLPYPAGFATGLSFEKLEARGEYWPADTKLSSKLDGLLPAGMTA